MHKKNIRLLSTGTLSNEIIHQLSDPLISVDIIAFTSIQPFIDAETAKKIETIAAQPATVIFTSANAVRAVTEKLIHIPDWKIFCTGGPTQQEVISFFGSAAVAGAAENAAALAQKIIAWQVKDAVFFCGRQRLDVLPDALRDAAISTSEYTVYDTEPVRHILDNSYDGILFYSPLAVKTFFLDNDILPETVVFALGTTTSAAIRAFLKRDARLAPAPEKSALLRSAIDYFTLQKIQGT